MKIYLGIDKKGATFFSFGRVNYHLLQRSYKKIYVFLEKSKNIVALGTTLKNNSFSKFTNWLTIYTSLSLSLSHTHTHTLVQSE